RGYRFLQTSAHEIARQRGEEESRTRAARLSDEREIHRGEGLTARADAELLLQVVDLRRELLRSERILQVREEATQEIALLRREVVRRRRQRVGHGELRLLRRPALQPDLRDGDP